MNYTPYFDKKSLGPLVTNKCEIGIKRCQKSVFGATIFFFKFNKSTSVNFVFEI